MGKRRSCPTASIWNTFHIHKIGTFNQLINTLIMNNKKTEVINRSSFLYIFECHRNFHPFLINFILHIYKETPQEI